MIKISESVFRSLQNGEMKERVDMTQHVLMDGDQCKGNIYVYADHAELRLDVSEIDSIEAGETKFMLIIAAIEDKL